jgi:Family of unknown function (DUF5723)
MQPKRIVLLWYAITFAFLSKTTSVTAQEQLGLRLDNYAGVNALVLNPAANATNPLTWDINLVGFGAWVNTNIGYLNKANIPKALNNIDKIGPDPSLNLSHKGSPTLLFNINDRTSYGFTAGGRVIGPSLAFKLKSGHSFGIFTGLRSMVSSHNLPSLLNPSEFNKFTLNKAFNVDAFKVAGLAWSEIGLNYAYQFDTDTEGGVTIGANVKYMQGFQSFFFNNYKGTSAAQNDKETYQINAIRATTGFTTNYDTNPLGQNGKGLGFDIGMVLKTDGGNDKPYQWRLGASLIDLGSITITGAAEVHSFNSNEAFQIKPVDFDSVGKTANPRTAALSIVDDKISNAKNNTLVGNSYSVSLPSAIQLQADYAFTNNLYVNALVIQRFRINEVALERDNIIALTPRYESRWVGASMPISVINMEKMQVGLNARLAFLSFGTDHLFSWIGHGKLSSTDFYIALKVNPFQLNFLHLGSRQGGKKVNCYRF